MLWPYSGEKYALYNTNNKQGGLITTTWTSTLHIQQTYLLSI